MKIAAAITSIVILLILVMGGVLIRSNNSRASNFSQEISMIQDQDDRQDAFNKRLTEVEHRQEALDKRTEQIVDVLTDEYKVLKVVCGKVKCDQ